MWVTLKVNLNMYLNDSVKSGLQCPCGIFSLYVACDISIVSTSFVAHSKYMKQQDLLLTKTQSYFTLWTQVQLR